jgi:predicted Zn-dependent protease
MLVRGISDNVSYVCRQEIEADYIGILLLGAAGFHPQWNLVAMGKAAELTRGPFQLLGHPSPKKRLQHLSEPKTMQEALELYREVTALDKVTDWYFK